MPSWEDLLSTPYGKATPEQIKRAQEHAYALLKPRETPNRSWASPIADVLHALQGNSMLNRSTNAQADQRQDLADSHANFLTEIQNRARTEQRPPVETGSLPLPQQTAMNAPSPEATPAPSPNPQMTPDDGSAIEQPSTNQIEAPKTGFKLDDYLKSLAGVESSGGKNTTPNKYGYGGPFGLRKGENGLTDANWGQPEAHVGAAVKKTLENVNAFKQQFGREPSNEELHLMHNQGATGGIAHIGSEPNKPAWKVLQDTTNIKENLAKERISAQISPSSDLAKKPIDSVTTSEFQKYLADKFNGGWQGGTKSQAAMMRLGGPTEESAAPAGPQGQQVAQNTAIPPAVQHPAGLVDKNNLARLLQNPQLDPATRANIEKMMIEGATPDTRETAKGVEERRPSNPTETSMPGAVSDKQHLQLHGLSIPIINTRLPDGTNVQQFMIPGQKGLKSAEDLMEWGRQQQGLDTRQGVRAKDYADKETDIQNRAVAASKNKQMLSIAKSLSNDPAFYTGTGANRVLDYTKIASYLTGNPNWSGSTEAFSKVMAGANIAGLEAFKGYGQIRNPEIELLQQSQGNINNSEGAIKAIITMNERASERLEEIGDKMREYRKAHKQLDEGFDEEMAKFYKDKPLFTDQELKDYRKTLFGEKAGPSPSNENLGKGLSGIRKPVDDEGYTKYPGGRIRQVQ